MDILLINTPIFDTKRAPDPEDSVPPIGIGYIYTQLIHSGYECKFVDAYANGQTTGEIIKAIDESDADYIGLNVFSSNLRIVRLLVEKVRPPRKFFLGGPAARTLISEVDGWNTNGSITLVIGEAELILPEMIRHPELAEKRSSKLNIFDVTPKSSFFPTDINGPLDRSIFTNEPVRKDLGVVEAHIIASRGCCYDCAFCTAARSLNPHINPRYRTYDSLSKEIETIQKSHPETNCIRVLDDLFLRDQASIELAIELFLENKMSWRSMAHVNTFRDLSSKRIDELKYSGCRELFMGIESGNDETLKHIRKPFTVDTAYKTVSRILDAQIAVKCYFILGFPGETESAAKDTIILASRLREYADKKGVQLRISPFQFRPYHGTTLYDEIVKKGQTITPIRNRADISDTGTANPFDCISGVYAEYDEQTLDNYLTEINSLNTQNI
jgi:anaerobic magnesium-protoporphyrin IX monomethyl ester cyclase